MTKSGDRQIQIGGKITEKAISDIINVTQKGELHATLRVIFLSEIDVKIAALRRILNITIQTILSPSLL